MTTTALKNIIFLGGTCGKNHWREDIVIPGLLERGVSPDALFNPVVPDGQPWDDAAREREDEIKHTARWQLYVIASPDPGMAECPGVSGYSLVEATMGLYDAPERTLVLVDTMGMAKHTAKSIAKTATDWHRRFPNAPIFADYAALIEWLAPRLREDESTWPIS